MSLLTLLCFRYNPIYSIYIYPIYPIRYIQFWILYRITACITLICFVSAMSFPVEQKSYKKEQIVILVIQKKAMICILIVQKRKWIVTFCLRKRKFDIVTFIYCIKELWIIHFVYSKLQIVTIPGPPPSPRKVTIRTFLYCNFLSFMYCYNALNDIVPFLIRYC